MYSFHRTRVCGNDLNLTWDYDCHWFFFLLYLQFVWCRDFRSITCTSNKDKRSAAFFFFYFIFLPRSQFRSRQVEGELRKLSVMYGEKEGRKKGRKKERKYGPLSSFLFCSILFCSDLFPSLPLSFLIVSNSRFWRFYTSPETRGWE